MARNATINLSDNEVEDVLAYVTPRRKRRGQHRRKRNGNRMTQQATHQEHRARNNLSTYLDSKGEDGEAVTGKLQQKRKEGG